MILVLQARFTGDWIWVDAQKMSLPFNRDLSCKVANPQVQDTFWCLEYTTKTPQDSIMIYNCWFSSSQLTLAYTIFLGVGWAVGIPQLLAKHDVGQNCSGHHPQGQPGM